MQMILTSIYQRTQDFLGRKPTDVPKKSEPPVGVGNPFPSGYCWSWFRR